MLTNSSSSGAARELRPTPAWIKKSFRERNVWERLATIELASDKCYTVQPRNPSPPPKLSPWRERLWLTSAIAPALIMQALWYQCVPVTSPIHTWHPIVAFIFCHLSLVDLLGLPLLVVSPFGSHRSLSLEIPQQAPFDEASIATAEYSRR